MRELEYPFDSELIRKKRLKYRKALLSDTITKYLEKRIAILGGSTTDEIKNMMELFLLNVGIKATFYESEYKAYRTKRVDENRSTAR